MSAEYSVEEVRAQANYEGRASGEQRTYEMLTAYAERIEADERAVPVAWLSEGEGALESWQPTYIVGVDEESCREAVHESLVGWNPYRVFPVYIHPPAQAAQVDRYRELCGAIYQAAGAYNLPVRFLDALSDASMGKIEDRQKTDSLLPCYAPTAEPAAQSLDPTGGIGLRRFQAQFDDGDEE